MPVAPATIVRTNRSWPGTSTTDSSTAGRQLERRVAELDRDPACALLGQAVGVDSGQRSDQRRLAVIDVPGSAEREGGAHRCRASAARAAAATASSSSSASVRGSSSEPPVVDAGHHRGPAVAQRIGEFVWYRVPQRHRRAVELQRAAARRLRPSPRRARSRCPTGRSPPPGVRLAGPESPRPRPAWPGPGSRAGPLRISVEPQRGLERRQRELVQPQRAGQGVALGARHGSRRPTISPACGPPSSLSPEQQIERGSGGRSGASASNGCWPSGKSGDRDRARCGRAARIARNAASLGVPDLSIVTGGARQRWGTCRLRMRCSSAAARPSPGLIDAAWAALPSGGRLVANGVTLETHAGADPTLPHDSAAR